MLLFYRVLLLLAGLLALICGLLAVVRPRAVQQFNLPLGRMLAVLQSEIRVERYYYRYHKVTGPVTILGGAILCQAAWIVSSPGIFPEPWRIVQQSLAITYALFGIGVVALGVVVTIRPSALKALEAWSNTRITRQTLRKRMVRFRMFIVDWTLKYPRGFGILAVLAGSGLLCVVLRSLQW